MNPIRTIQMRIRKEQTMLKTIKANLVAFPDGLLLHQGEQIKIIDKTHFTREKTGETFEIESTEIFNYATE